jgi:hypothetical protein
MIGGTDAVPGYLAGSGDRLVRRADIEVPKAMLSAERQARRPWCRAGSARPTTA